MTIDFQEETLFKKVLAFKIAKEAALKVFKKNIDKNQKQEEEKIKANYNINPSQWRLPFEDKEDDHIDTDIFLIKDVRDINVLYLNFVRMNQRLPRIYL